MFSQILFLPMAHAEDRWVADIIYLPLRSGEGENYRILATLKTGTRLTVVTEKPDSEWVEVRTRSGMTGFVRTQHLLDEPTASQQLEAVRAELEKLRNEYGSLRTQLDSTRVEGDSLSDELRRTQDNLVQLQTDYDELKKVSESAVTLHDRHGELLHNYELLKTELDVMKAKNIRLQSESRNTFFLYGAGSVLLGVIITLLVPHLRRRKRFSEWAN